MKVEAASSSFATETLPRAVAHHAAEYLQRYRRHRGSAVPARPRHRRLRPSLSTLSQASAAGRECLLAAADAVLNNLYRDHRPDHGHGIALAWKLGYDEPRLDPWRPHALFQLLRRSSWVQAPPTSRATVTTCRIVRRCRLDSYHFLFNNAVVLDDPFIAAQVYYIINTK